MMVRHWTKLFALSVAVPVLAAACGTFARSVPTSTPFPTASIQFLGSPFDLDGIQWMEDQAQEFGVHFAPTGIYALDKETAFLFGGLRIPAGTLRSLLLRTADGGQHWQEVMAPVLGSSVVLMNFVEGGRGWALALWEVEGFGSMVLFQTVDYGLTWTKRSDVPKLWYGYPLELAFLDDTHGQIDVMYDAGLPSTNRIAYLTTQDGGVTWLETSSVPFDPTAEEAYPTALAPYLENGAASLYESFQSMGSDGSYWALSETVDRDGLLVSHRFERAQEIFHLPTHFPYVESGENL